MAVVGACALAIVSGQAVASSAPSSGGDAAQLELQAYVLAHPDDYVGVNQRLIATGQPPLQVKVNGRAGTVDAATAAAIKKTKSGQRAGSGTVSPQAVPPTDSFGVSGYWVSIFISAVNTSIFVGNWDFPRRLRERQRTR